ncbi:MAG: HD domain-containing protein, partial [Treponema sp.]|nr:HD domain-containing protein [Treponema sp.]
SSTAAAFPFRRFSAAGFTVLDFYRDLQTGAFLDPRSQYPLLRMLYKKAADPADLSRWRRAFTAGTGRFRLMGEAALILSRYDTAAEPLGPVLAELCAVLDRAAVRGTPPAEAQRLLLSALLLSSRPDRGLELLKAAGFLADAWPELALLDNAEHSKEFHPEGNAWRHTLETFRYRKPGISGTQDLRLSLALLLHDTGKPLAGSAGGRRFDGHAELGAETARRFLERLEFPSPVVDDVCYLVKNHMLPAALPRLPLSRTEAVMNSPLFPVLMELYRCDESSSFKGLDRYYQSSAAYQKFLRQRRNPYRRAAYSAGGRG